MRKLAIFIIGVLLLSASACRAEYPAQYYPFYWISGGVRDAADGAGADGRQVVFFKNAVDYGGGAYSAGLSGASGIAGQSRRFMLNAFGLGLGTLDLGASYYVAIPNDNPADPSAGYGADPVAVTISGQGVDEPARDLVLVRGAGSNLGGQPAQPVIEPAPSIKLWFNNRLYQLTPAQIAQGDKFVISDQPKIKAVVSISEPYAVASGVSGYSVTIDPGTPASRSLTLNASHLTSQVYAAEAGAQNLRSLNLEYSVTEPLAEGAHTISVSAQSSGALGTASTATALVTVEVMGGPVRLLGAPLCWPSPYSIANDRTVYIQYTLSRNAPIEIIFADISGERVKNFFCEAGAEGGSAGVNKVSWNGRTDRGQLAGNGIYVGLIIAREEGRKLGTVKLTVVN